MREGKAKDASRSLYQQQAASSNLAAKILTEEADGAALPAREHADRRLVDLQPALQR